MQQNKLRPMLDAGMILKEHRYPLHRPSHAEQPLIVKKSVMIAHICVFSVTAQWATRNYLRFMFAFSIAVMVANIRVEDRGAALVLLGRRIVSFGADAGGLQLV